MAGCWGERRWRRPGEFSGLFVSGRDVPCVEDDVGHAVTSGGKPGRVWVLRINDGRLSRPVGLRCGVAMAVHSVPIEHHIHDPLPCVCVTAHTQAMPTYRTRIFSNYETRAGTRRSFWTARTKCLRGNCTSNSTGWAGTRRRTRTPCRCWPVSTPWETALIAVKVSLMTVQHGASFGRRWPFSSKSVGDVLRARTSCDTQLLVTL